MSLFQMVKCAKSVSNLFCLCITLVTTVEREHVRESSLFVFLWSFGFSALSISTPASITEACKIKLFTCVIYSVMQQHRGFLLYPQVLNKGGSEGKKQTVLITILQN
jgi:hypothetical protein